MYKKWSSWEWIIWIFCQFSNLKKLVQEWGKIWPNNKFVAMMWSFLKTNMATICFVSPVKTTCCSLAVRSFPVDYTMSFCVIAGCNEALRSRYELIALLTHRSSPSVSKTFFLHFLTNSHSKWILTTFLIFTWKQCWALD